MLELPCVWVAARARSPSVSPTSLRSLGKSSSCVKVLERKQWSGNNRLSVLPKVCFLLYCYNSRALNC
eukprot:scaffold73056_cov60-Phaeocystis_antarctica.AAC.4